MLLKSFCTSMVEPLGLRGKLIIYVIRSRLATIMPNSLALLCTGDGGVGSSWLRFSDDGGLRLEFAAVEGAWALYFVCFGGCGGGRDGGADFQSALLHHLRKPHARHTLGRVVEPLTNDYLPVVRRARIGLALLQALLHQHVGQKAVTQLRGFERGLIALRRRQDIHALLVGQLRQALRVHRPAPLLIRFERLPRVARVEDEDELTCVERLEHGRTGERP